MKPILRYFGSKRREAKLIVDMIAERRGTRGHYVEPFVGGGSVLLKALERLSWSKVMASDSLTPLVRWWQAASDHPEWLIDATAEILATPNLKRHYLDVLRNVSDPYANVFWAIVKCSWRGILRGRANGALGGPWGGDPSPLPSLDEVRSVSRLIRNVTFHCEPWEKTLDLAAPANAVVYLDPPYAPKGGFVEYGGQKWTSEDARLLFASAARLADTGALVLISYRATKGVTKWAETNRFDVINVEETRRIRQAKAQTKTSEPCVLLVARER